MTRNERTSRKAARVAAEVLALKPWPASQVITVLTGVGRGYGFSWSDIRALAASALTQTADKPKRTVRKSRTVAERRKSRGKAKARKARKG